MAKEEAAPRQITVAPPERVVITPAGYMVERGEGDTWNLNFLVSQFKLIIVVLTDEEKRGLVGQLTGLRIARPGE